MKMVYMRSVNVLYFSIGMHFLFSETSYRNKGKAETPSEKMMKTDRMILLMHSVFQERYLRGNAIAKNLYTVAELMIKPEDRTPRTFTNVNILHETLFKE